MVSMMKLLKMRGGRRKNQIFANNLDVTVTQSLSDPDRKLFSLEFSDSVENKEVTLTMSHDSVREIIELLKGMLDEADKLGAKP